jgi:RimJ/RimL family protein N-acetyltransferase
MADASGPAPSLLPERIVGEGLELRRWLASDAEAQQRIVLESASHLRPWMAWMADEPQPLEQRRAMLARWERDWAAGGDVALAIVWQGELVGSGGLHRRRGPRTLEIGYWIHAATLRRGLATRTARLLTDAALSLDGIEYVEIHHDRANVASAGVPRRLGFEFIGETPDQARAPAEQGVDCTWRVSRRDWLTRARR